MKVLVISSKYQPEYSGSGLRAHNTYIRLKKNYNINYESFLEKHKIELLWNTLIYQIYNNQINVNIIEVENEVAKIINKKEFLIYEYNYRKWRI